MARLIQTSLINYPLSILLPLSDGKISYCHDFNIPHDDPYIPLWSVFKQGAPLQRNQTMVHALTGPDDYGIAIWDGLSHGTLDTIRRLKKAGKLLRLFVQKNMMLDWVMSEKNDE